MKLPLELSNCIVDLEEVTYIVYHLAGVSVIELTTRQQFAMAPTGDKMLTVALRGGTTFTLSGEDAAVFVEVFGKQVKEWVNEQILQWRKGYEETKDQHLVD